MASVLPGLRRAAPRLSRNFFTCHECTKQALSPRLALKLPVKSRISRSIRFNSSAVAFPEGLSGSRKAAPLSSLSQNILKKGDVAGKKFFPETTSKSVAYWLLGSAASVFGIVVFGGLTRLTESGYVIPPTSVNPQLLILSKSKYNRMETSNRLLAPTIPRRLGI